MAKTINLTDKADKKNGTGGDDTIYAKGGNDTIDGKNGNDYLDGGDGDDRLTGGQGNDTVIGGEGKDTAVYGGVLQDKHGNPQYAFDLDAQGHLIVTDLNKKDGVDTLDSIEYLQFKDKKLAVADVLQEINSRPAVLSVDPMSLSIKEGTSDQPTPVDLHLHLSHPSDQPVSVHVATIAGSAKANSDFTPLDQVVTFQPGETEQTVTVLVTADSVKENDESFTVRLDNVKGAQLAMPNPPPGNGDDHGGEHGGDNGHRSKGGNDDHGNDGHGNDDHGNDDHGNPNPGNPNPGNPNPGNPNSGNPPGPQNVFLDVQVRINDDDKGGTTPSNHTPQPQDDHFSGLPVGQPVTTSSADLLKNDQDSDGDTLTITQVGNASAGTVSFDSSKGQVVFTPNAGTSEGSYSYTVSDGKGGSATAKVSLHFGSDTPTPTDTTPPTLLSSNPADESVGIPVSSNLTLKFSEPVKAGAGNFVISNGVDTQTISAADSSQVAISGDVVTINPSLDLQNSSVYAVLVSKDAILDTAGNAYAGISDSTSLNFTTSPAAVGTADTLVAVSAAGVGDASVGNVAFQFAPGIYAYSISGFGAGDVLDFPEGQAPTVNNTSFADSQVDLQWAFDGKVVTVTLTGLSTPQDTALLDATAFNNVFGAGTII